MALPARIRRACNQNGVDGLVLTFHKGALWGWTPEDFEEQVERPLSKTDPFDSDVVDFAHGVLAPAQDVSIDNQGRILIPPPLRDLAGLGKDVVVNSILQRIEIWDRETWDARFQTSLDRMRDRTAGMPGSNA